MDWSGAGFNSTEGSQSTHFHTDITLRGTRAERGQKHPDGTHRRSNRDLRRGFEHVEEVQRGDSCPIHGYISGAKLYALGKQSTGSTPSELESDQSAVANQR
ncbi:hypothetical protein WMY93_019501 [Mugilogobius chulae]|uniref:Uncharacterized protein n=1 Tax=Mugilogobius chulae TaxID=88201 RepID=A0AAW0NFI2_9GOBI